MRRKAAGRTQDEVAERLGVTKSAVSKWESLGPPTERIEELAAYLGFSTNEAPGMPDVPAAALLAAVLASNDTAAALADGPAEEVNDGPWRHRAQIIDGVMRALQAAAKSGPGDVHIGLTPDVEPLVDAPRPQSEQFWHCLEKLVQLGFPVMHYLPADAPSDVVLRAGLLTARSWRAQGSYSAYRCQPDAWHALGHFVLTPRSGLMSLGFRQTGTLELLGAPLDERTAAHLRPFFNATLQRQRVRGLADPRGSMSALAEVTVTPVAGPPPVAFAQRRTVDAEESVFGGPKDAYRGERWPISLTPEGIDESRQRRWRSDRLDKARQQMLDTIVSLRAARRDFLQRRLEAGHRVRIVVTHAAMLALLDKTGSVDWLSREGYPLSPEDASRCLEFGVEMMDRFENLELAVASGDGNSEGWKANWDVTGGELVQIEALVGDAEVDVVVFHPAFGRSGSALFEGVWSRAERDRSKVRELLSTKATALAHGG